MAKNKLTLACIFLSCLWAVFIAVSIFGFDLDLMHRPFMEFLLMVLGVLFVPFFLSVVWLFAVCLERQKKQPRPICQHPIVLPEKEQISQPTVFPIKEDLKADIPEHPVLQISKNEPLEKYKDLELPADIEVRFQR